MPFPYDPQGMESITSTAVLSIASAISELAISTLLARNLEIRTSKLWLRFKVPRLLWER
ncbi:unnamed protein product, partial [Nesidiocoris tenuis]